MPFMEGLAEGAGYAGGQGLLGLPMLPINMAVADRDRRKNEQSSKRLIEHQAEVSNDLQSKRNRSSLGELAQGAVNAGFSPLAALDAATSGSQPSNVMPSSSTKQMDAPNLLEASQARLANAEAEKAEAEADRMRHEDTGSNRALITFADHVLQDPSLSDDAKLYWNHIKRLGEKGELNVGDIKSQRNFEDLLTLHSDATTKVVSNEYARLLVKAQKDANAPKWLAKMPESEVKHLGRVMGKLYAETMKLNSETALNIDSREKEIKANTAKLLAEAKSITHNDVVELWESDTKGWFVKLGTGAAEATLANLPSILSKGKVPPKLGKVRELDEMLTKNKNGYTRQTREVMKYLAPPK